jgi:hypothetical protein
LIPEVRKAIAFVLETRQEIAKLEKALETCETWLKDRGIDRRLWDPARKPPLVRALVRPLPGVPVTKPQQDNPRQGASAELPTKPQQDGALSKPVKWTETDRAIIEAGKRIYSDGVIPADIDPATLMHAIESLYKREAEAQSRATGKHVKPRDPPSWHSCARFLKKWRTSNSPKS